MPTKPMNRPGDRASGAIRSVLPASAPMEVHAGPDGLVEIEVGPSRFSAVWIGEGRLRDVQAALTPRAHRPDVLVARRMSPAAQSAAAQAKVGWVDESGAAVVVLFGLVVSRTGRPEPRSPRQPRWAASVIGTAEALLVGTNPTVADVRARTGLSAGGATNALAALTSLGLLEAKVARGPASARKIVDRDRLLEDYAVAAKAKTPKLSLRVGTSARDLMDELARLGKQWDSAGLAWAASGAAGASRLDPNFSQVTGLDVLVDAQTPAALFALAEGYDLEPIEGGRILLRPFPTKTTARLCCFGSGLRVAPWPRIYADLISQGVRGEEAAEHLRQQMDRV